MKISNNNRKIIYISFFSALTAVGAFIKIPLPHIPITLQTFIVLMSANLCGPKISFFSQIIYLILGLIGIPVFAYGGGLGYIFQPSFGYLLSYPVCALIIGYLLKFFQSGNIRFKNSKYKMLSIIVFADIIGVLVIFIIGLAYLYFNIKYSLYLEVNKMLLLSNLNWQKALNTTIFIFFPIELIKILLAAFLTIKLKEKLKFQFEN